ncbi:hypothetical protein E5288_WYG003905 [Bos mutus]|uniref:Distal membrane-arm assembly complex protein 1-like domain-containing protein n=1 Tax=Bos mutus TaxID=72004 RepID=A0A6B0RWI1_9CETA|nr:hypothetical protein [Bos mutus]
MSSPTFLTLSTLKKGQKKLHFPVALRQLPVQRAGATSGHICYPLEPVKFVAPPEATSTPKPAQVTAPGAPASPAQAPLFNNCWSCRVLSGSGLIGAGGYVYWMARKPMKLGYPPGPGTIAQMIFGISESLGTTLGPGEREREKRRSEIRHVGRGGAGGEAPRLVTWPQASPPALLAGVWSSCQTPKGRPSALDESATSEFVVPPRPCDTQRKNGTYKRSGQKCGH